MVLSFVLRTFGCKTNQYESQGIRQGLLDAGFVEVELPADADILIVNTCTVTGKAGAGCSYEIRRCLRENPALRVLVTGCAVDVSDEWLEQESAVEAVFANPHKSKIADYLTGVDTSSLTEQKDDRFAFGLNQFHGHTRAFIKVQDGCDNFCSYCIIPYARGVPASRALEDILAEARRLCEAGYHELVLTGINIGAYNYEGVDLPKLLEQLVLIPGLWRLRLGSVEPIYLDDELLDVMRDNEIICPHLHLPLQSGDDSVLSAMNRKYTVAQFLEAVERCRTVLDNPAITTDLICGFPTEDETCFQQTLQTVRSASFSRMHIFPYSVRQGTPAADMKQCDPKVVNRRKEILANLAKEMAAEYAAGLVGSTQRVILEQKQKIGFTGYNSRYMRVVVENPDPCLRQGQMVEVSINRSKGAELFGGCVAVLREP